MVIECGWFRTAVGGESGACCEDGGEGHMRESVSKAHELSGRRLVAFDFDGTLADTKPQIVRVARQVLLERGLTDEQLVDVDEIIGPPFPQAFMMVFGLSENDASDVTDAYRAIYARLGPKAWPLFDGVTKLLQRLKDRGKVLATVSSKRLEILRRGLVDNGILESFDVVLGSDSDRPQTKAQALLEAIESCGMGVEDAVMVGDRRYDVEVACTCNVPCVGVEFGHTAKPGELERARASVVVSTVDELSDVLLGEAAKN